MFYGCSSLEKLDLSKWNVSKIKNLQGFLYKCSQLTEVNLSDWNAANCTDMSQMFAYCTSLSSVNLSSINTPKVTNIEQMFRNCEALVSVDLSSLDTSNVKDMDYMFFECKKLRELDLSTFNTEKLVFLQNTFNSCSSLERLDLSSWYVPKSTFFVANILDGDYKLSELVIGPEFYFHSNFILPHDTDKSPYMREAIYTGKWVRVNADGEEYGKAYTSLELRYNPEPADQLAGTWTWQRADIRIKFDGSGAEGTMNDYIVDTNSVFNLPDCEYVNELADFVGWQAVNTNNSWESTRDFTENEPVYIWKYNTGNSSNVKYSWYLVKQNNPTGSQAHYWWKFDDDGNGVASKTLYARWSYNKYKIEFDAGADEAAGSMADIIVPRNEAQTLPQPGFYWFKHICSNDRHI